MPGEDEAIAKAGLGGPGSPGSIDRSPSSPAPHSEFDFSAATAEGLFIGISGLIGAGKTTLATALAKEMGLPVHYEPVTDNEYLSDFYSDMAK